jgi:hypothetical protein
LALVGLEAEVSMRWVTDVRTAIIDRLREIGVHAGKPSVICDIGGSSIADGYDQLEIVNGLYSLERERVIELTMSTP